METVIFKTTEDILSFDFRNDLNKDIFYLNFASLFDESTKLIKEPIFPFDAVLKVPKGNRFLFNDTEIKTTVGRYLASIFILHPVYIKTYGMVNRAINKSTINEILKLHSILLVSSKISDEDYADMINRSEWLGNLATNLAGDSFSYSSLVIPDDIKELMDDLLNKVPKEKLIDPEYISYVEKTLIAKVKEEMGEEGLIKIIESGSKGDFGNNFKNMALFRGIVNGKFIPNNLVDGNDFTAYMALGSNAVAGSSGRAIKTAEGVIAPHIR